MNNRQKIMNRLLKACFIRHGKKIPVEYQPYILGMMREYGGKQFLIGFLMGIFAFLFLLTFYFLLQNT
jgi:hypothetical protein